MNLGKQIAAVFANPDLGLEIEDEKFWETLEQLYRNKYEDLVQRQCLLEIDLREALYLRLRGRLERVPRIDNGSSRALEDLDATIMQVVEEYNLTPIDPEVLRQALKRLNKMINLTRRGLWLGQIARAWVTVNKRAMQLIGVAQLLNERIDADVPVPTVVDGFMCISQLKDVEFARADHIRDEMPGVDDILIVGMRDIVPVATVLTGDQFNTGCMCDQQQPQPMA